ncbi:MAG: GDP-mannose 4,6-dehydratase [Candidatus Omnitrophota bacterium]|nr:GDP-mannose 4,6-dehydratase [Candidatus Omnitrophota bacterium]
MKLLVTGGCGFIGSNFIRYILQMYPEYKVINLDALNYAGNLENLSDIAKNKNYKFIKGDIRNFSLVKKLIKGIDYVVNFAAQTHVDRSIKEAKDFIETNINGVFTLLETAKDSDIKKIIHISCYDEETRALTTEGLKTYKELKRGDYVFSLNPKTKEIEIKPIEKVIIQPYKGEMVRFKNKRIDLLVTPNHNMFIINTNKSRMLVETAEECSKRCFFYTPKGYWVGKDEEWFGIEGHGKVRTEDLMYILGIFIGDGFIAYQEKEVETKSGLSRKEFLEKSRDKDTGQFRKIEKHSDCKSLCHSYRIFFDIPVNDKCRKKVEETLFRLKVKYNCHAGKAGTHLYFTSQAFMKFFEQCGRGARNKHIPRWALDYSPKYLRHLLQGLMDSDGHNDKIYHTVSEKLTYDIAELCIKVGLQPSIHKKHSKSFLNGRKIEGDSHYVFVANTIKSISRHKIKKFKYEGDIWCLKVKDNKNFLVERNGRFDFCGNTDEVYGSILEGSFIETDPLFPSSPYSASKAAADVLCNAYALTYRIPVIITRSSNNFGSYQYPEKVIPLFITNVLERKKVPLYGDGLNVRDWLYVLDNVRAIDFLLRKGDVGQIYNISSNNEINNIELTRIILKKFDLDENWIKYVKDRPAHDRRYSLDSSRLRSLGWKPIYDFSSSLDATIDWYKNNTKWWKKIKPSVKHRAKAR